MPNTQQQSPKAADSSSDIINRGALYNLLGYLGKIGRPLSMLLVPLFYGAQVNDWYILALFTYEVCVRLSESGVHKGLLIRIPAYQQETSPILVPRAIWTAFIFSALVSVIVVTITIFLASRWTSGNELEFLRWFVVAIPFTVGTNVLCHATMAQKTMKYQVLIKKIGDPVFVFSFIAIVGLLKLPPLSVVFAILCSSMATMVWAAWAVSRLYDFRAIIRVGLQGHFDRDLILFSFPLGLGDFLNKLLFSMDVFALRYFGVPGGYLGIYGLASRLVNVFREIRKLFDPLITPIFSEHYQKKNLPVVEELIHRLTMWVTALVVPIMMFLIVFGQDLSQLLAKGDSFQFLETFPFRTVLFILMFGILFRAVAFISFASVISAGYTRLDLFNNIIGFVTISVLLLGLAPLFGVQGAAISVATTVIIISLIQWRQVRNYVGVRPFSGTVYKMIGLSFGLTIIMSIPLVIWNLDNQLAVRIGLYVIALTTFAALVWKRVGRRLVHSPDDEELAKRNLRKRELRQTTVTLQPWTLPSGLRHADKAPNILLIVTDCLRGDRIVGDNRSCQTPHLDNLRRNGVSFNRAYASTVHTTPSITSMLTGDYPFRHGISSIFSSLQQNHIPMMQEILLASGYRTFGFATGPLERARGLTRGFTRYNYRSRRDALISGNFGDEFRTEFTAIQQEDERPWLVMLHLWEIHQRWHNIKPVSIKPDFRSTQFGATNYDRAVSSLDDDLGFLLDNLPDDTLTIFTGDHGDNITTNQRYLGARMRKALGGNPPLRSFHRSHGFHVFNFLINVPLIMHYPNVMLQGLEVTQKVHMIDVLPTTLELCGLSNATSTIGRSLTPLLSGSALNDVPLYLEAQSQRTARRDWRRGVYLDPWKYSYTPAGATPQVELYNTDTDPQELNNVADQHPEIVRQLHAALEAIQK